VRIRPAHLQDNGSYEQFDRVLKAKAARPPATTLRAQQRRFKASSGIQRGAPECGAWAKASGRAVYAL